MSARRGSLRQSGEGGQAGVQALGTVPGNVGGRQGAETGHRTPGGVRQRGTRSRGQRLLSALHTGEEQGCAQRPGSESAPPTQAGAQRPPERSGGAGGGGKAI